MDRPITRRDFLNGVAVGVGGAALAPWMSACGGGPGAAKPTTGLPAPYPPALTGMRGSHAGSFEVAHSLRDGAFWSSAGEPQKKDDTYDLVVVGGGISGLASAYFFRKKVGPNARILVLDNHDDFGGHAKRNEFQVRGRLLIGYGGTQSIESPGLYSAVARGLLTDLAVDTARFFKAYDQELYKSLKLGTGVFFDKETFGADHLAVGTGELPWAQVLKDAPLSDRVKRDIARLHEKPLDYMPGVPPAIRKTRLAKMSYRDFLVKVARVDPGVVPFFQTSTHDLYGVGVEAVPALDCWGIGLPGFDGLKLDTGGGGGIGVTPMLAMNEEPYIFHFPDGNASIARLLIRSLVPASLAGHTMDDVVTARLDYGKLDDAASPVRIRLNSTVVRARHVGDPASAKEVEVVYAQGPSLCSVRARACVLACWNGVIPYMCPELPEPQREALAYGVKVPLVYTNVAIRDWTAFTKAKMSEVSAPGSFHSSVMLDFPVSLGEYKFSSSPEEPMVLHLLRTPCSPGLPPRQQHRAGRAELLSMSFETFERNTRDELARMLSGGGFDPARDIEGITVNRWPHGYAYEYSSLWDPDWKEDEKPCVIGRRRFGRFVIANSDAGAYAYTNGAIDQADRAIGELAIS
jgi:spermidine dehydrogenase